MQYIKQLDSFRALAVIFVIINHWNPYDNFLKIVPNWFLGSLGVDMFFVLSGFLISKILFDTRNSAEEFSISKSKSIRNFYLRRSLRIFPIYYLTIFVLLIFNKTTGTNIKSAFLYFATYTSNFYFFKIQTWDGMISHLWSLSVEEQYYLFWPWIIMFAPKKHILRIVVLFIMVGILSQFLLSRIYLNEILTFSCFDAFGLGALLSWQLTYGLKKIRQFYSIVTAASIVALIFLILYLMEIQLSIIPFRTIVSTISLWAITYIVLNKDSDKFIFRFVLNNKALLFLGKISYGVYLYHRIIPEMITIKINRCLHPILPELLIKNHLGKITLFENVILLISVSWLSYVLIEKRFLMLKKIFGYGTEKSGLA